MMSTILSFLGIAAAAQLTAVDVEAAAPPPKPLPKFKMRWWWPANMEKLDARPVAWSLRNHPEQWVQDGDDRITHLPSRHTFRVANGPLGLYAANCYCQTASQRSRGSFYAGQGTWTFLPTYLQWKEWDTGPGLHVSRSYDSNEPKNVTGQTPFDHFAAHFVN